MPSRSRRRGAAGSTETPPDEPPDESPDEAERPAGFGEFGVALVGEVVTARFVRRQLNAALDGLLSAAEPPEGFAADVTSATVSRVKLLSDDGRERTFAATVEVELESDVGPRLFAIGVDARVEIQLTVRLRAFRLAIVGFDFDPVTPDDVWVRTRTRSGWLPFSLGDGGRSGLTRAAERALPGLCETVNQELAAAVDRRRLDMLASLRSYGGSGAPVNPERPPNPGSAPRSAPRSASRSAPPRRRAERPTGFAELGEVLLRRGVDGRLVAALVGDRLTRPLPVEFDEPLTVRGTVVSRLVDVVPVAGLSDELRFRLSVRSDAQLLLGAGDEAARVTVTVRTDVPMRITTRVEPATLVIEFDPVSRMRVVRAQRAVRGRMLPIPLPNQTLGRVRRRVVAEVDRRLADSGVRLVAADVVERAMNRSD